MKIRTSLVFVTVMIFAGISVASTFDFNDYVLGPLNGQQGWTAPSNAVIVDDAPGFLFNALQLGASTTWSENSLPVGTSSFSFDFSITQGAGAGFPEELFFRYGGDGWGSFIAFKPQANVFEIRSNNEFYQPGGSNPTMPAGFQYGSVHNISATFSGNVVDLEFDGSPFLTATFADPVQLPEGNFDIRSTNVTSYIGNAIPEPGTALLLLVSGGLLLHLKRHRG